MTAVHLDDDALVALALDDIDPDSRTQALLHLRQCGACRTGYDEIRSAVDAVLPATPTLEPTSGFDERVLTAMGMATSTVPPVARRRITRRRFVPAAAALAVGLALGAGGTWLGTREDSQVVTIGTPLTDAAGAVVGSVIAASTAGAPTLVVAISHAPDGARYSCLVTLDDASTIDVGTWTLPDGEGTWVITDVDPSRVATVEMVRDDGTVWSSAALA